MSHEPTVTVPLEIRPSPAGGSAPVSAGVPLPRGVLREARDGRLVGPGGEELPVQLEPLGRWADGSIRWLLLDFLLPRDVSPGVASWVLHPERPTGGATAHITRRPDAVDVDTGTVRFELDGPPLQPLHRVRLGDAVVLGPPAARLVWTDAEGEPHEAGVSDVRVEAGGPIRGSVRIDGVLPELRVRARMSFFAGTGLARFDVTLHNPQRARHRGGLWDLGDAGSVLFQDLSLELPLPSGDLSLLYRAEPGDEFRRAGGELEVYQDSSGGENWRSPAHVNRDGVVPLQFRGYRVREGGTERAGLRAQPTVRAVGTDIALTVAVPEFWQQFPKAVEAGEGLLAVRLFPGQAGDLFELQGGERKTHTVWLHVGPPDGDPDPLAWVGQPPLCRPALAWTNGAGLVPDLEAPEGPSLERLNTVLGEALDGPNRLLTTREREDEYGWRHFGEVFADHERAYYKGTEPLVSHYNNQYDQVHGFLLHYLRTGDPRWFQLGDALARHVLDIDVYHTREDKWAYNGGLFWHTDHYKTAATATHRSYTRANRPPGRPYGGGPSSQHNYTTGLLLYHYLTGNPDAAEVVVSLADWVVRMDDGTRTIFSVVDDGPTGLASGTGSTFAYHGPGRGSGNSLNALLDGWALTGRRHYLDFAETLLRRCIHPREDVGLRGLDEPETGWSYTIFLTSLAKYLDLKAGAGPCDGMYAYARASLLHYGRWMLAHEYPYFDRPEKLEYPTEVWAAQEMRKANVFRRAARHAEEPLRGRLLEKGHSFAERAWKDLFRFQGWFNARVSAILLVEGLADGTLRKPLPEPAAAGEPDFGEPGDFVGQKARIKQRVRTPSGLVMTALRLANPVRWLRYRARKRWTEGEASA